jgi:hypothetical protein
MWSGIPQFLSGKRVASLISISPSSVRERPVEMLIRIHGTMAIYRMLYNRAPTILIAYP